MKLFLLPLFSLFLISCSPRTEVVYFQNEDFVKPEISQKIIKKEPPEESKEKIYIVDDDSRMDTEIKITALEVDKKKRLSDLIKEKGIPFDNIIPGRKEQIAVYKEESSYVFYFLREGNIFSAIEYSFPAIEEMKNNKQFPQKAIKDLRSV